MTAAEFFTTEEKQSILDAIVFAENETSGEIRVHLENYCSEDVLDRAAFLFEKLNMHQTIDRNGVLFYIAVKDKKFAILGDAGINAVVPADFWDLVKEKILSEFKENRFAAGIIEGVKMSGLKLKEHFPYQSDDVNELSDEISFGEN